MLLIILHYVVIMVLLCVQMTVDVAADELSLPVGEVQRGRRRADDVDLQILRNVRRTSARSCTLMSQLKTLKTKVYGLENDLRHL